MTIDFKGSHYPKPVIGIAKLSSLFDLAMQPYENTDKYASPKGLSLTIVLH